MRRPLKITKTQLREAIRDNGGVLVDVARSLGCSRRWVHERVNRWELKDEVDDARIRLVDEAVATIRNKILEGNLTASIYVTKALGGWRDHYVAVDHTTKGERVQSVTFVPAEPRDTDAPKD